MPLSMVVRCAVAIRNGKITNRTEQKSLNRAPYAPTVAIGRHSRPSNGERSGRSCGSRTETETPDPQDIMAALLRTPPPDEKPKRKPGSGQVGTHYQATGRSAGGVAASSGATTMCVPSAFNTSSRRQILHR